MKHYAHLTLLLAALALMPLPGRCAAPEANSTLDTATLIKQLARPAPASIAFTEVRFSPLLQQPIIVGGNLTYNSPTVLDRHVTRPYREDTAIRGESVTVQREGEPLRSFALKRAPELQGLLTAFTALLAGDQAAIERQFTIAAAGNDAQWRLVLAPGDARVRKRVKQIDIDGRGSTPRCFAIVSANQSASVMLLGAATETQLPQPLTRDWLTRFCSAAGMQ